MSDKWEMPEPVFRSSDGEVVVPGASPAPAAKAAPAAPADPAAEAEREVLQTLYAPPSDDADTAADVPAAEPVAAAPAAAAKSDAVPISDQPYVSEEIKAEQLKAAAAIRPSAPRKPGGSSGIVIKAIAGVILLAAIAAAGIFLYWFLFMRPPE